MLVDEGVIQYLIILTRRIFPAIDHTMGEVIIFAPIEVGSSANDGAPHDFFSIKKAMEDVMPVHLEQLVRELDVADDSMALMGIDLLPSFAIEVGNKCGVSTTGSWPAIRATYKLVEAIPELVQERHISDCGESRPLIVSIHALCFILSRFISLLRMQCLCLAYDF